MCTLIVIGALNRPGFQMLLLASSLWLTHAAGGNGPRKSRAFLPALRFGFNTYMEPWGLRTGSHGAAGDLDIKPFKSIALRRRMYMGGAGISECPIINFCMP